MLDMRHSEPPAPAGVERAHEHRLRRLREPLRGILAASAGRLADAQEAGGPQAAPVMARIDEALNPAKAGTRSAPRNPGAADEGRQPARTLARDQRVPHGAVRTPTPRPRSRGRGFATDAAERRTAPRPRPEAGAASGRPPRRPAAEGRSPDPPRPAASTNENSRQIRRPEGPAAAEPLLRQNRSDPLALRRAAQDAADPGLCHGRIGCTAGNALSSVTSVWQKRCRFSRTPGLPGGFRSAFFAEEQGRFGAGAKIFAFSSVFRAVGAGSAVGRLPAVRFPGEAPLRRRAVVGLAAAVARIPAASACVPSAPACALPAPVRVPAAFACVAAASACACARAGSARSGGR